ncbi:hypothetical protein Tco_1079715 [Tanacetum coccineum]|uniref:Uncharacterized protein n=1 Tax=Tanacetum coccineum TaxID=301880 RepID=A0ABQ5HU49_9ASTR
MDLTILVCPLISVLASLKRLVLRVGLSIRGATSKRNATWLILPVVICLSQRLSHACVIKKLVVGLWVGSAGPPYGVHRFTRPFCRRCAPGLNWLGRASGAVTLKKLECSKQAYALRTTAKAFAKDVFINQERKLGARRRSDTVLVSTINDADQVSADVAYRTPLTPYKKSKFLGSGGSGPVSVDVDFGSALVMKRVSKTIGLLDAVAKINDPQCELLLIRACAGVSKLYFAMRTCPPRVFESAQLSFDMALRSALEHIVTASGPGFGDWQWRLATLPFAFGGLGVYSAGDVLNYAFVASRLQFATLQTKLLRHVGIVTSGLTFDDALCMFNKAMKIDFSKVHQWMSLDGLMAISKGESHFRLASCGFDFWVGTDYEREDVPFSGKEVDIGLDGGHDKKLCPADMLLYSWDGGLDVCVDLTGSSPLTQTGMTDFAPGRAVTDAAHRKRGKYMAKCAAIGYGFLPFSFSSLGELETGCCYFIEADSMFSLARHLGSSSYSYF